MFFFSDIPLLPFLQKGKAFAELAAFVGHPRLQSFYFFFPFSRLLLWSVFFFDLDFLLSVIFPGPFSFFGGWRFFFFAIGPRILPASFSPSLDVFPLHLVFTNFFFFL